MRNLRRDAKCHLKDGVKAKDIRRMTSVVQDDIRSSPTGMSPKSTRCSLRRKSELMAV